MLCDRFQRIISYLRISVTDRCNFRCVYCMPAEGISLAPREDLLTFEEITRVARVGADLGLTKIRLTGGEPTVRKDLPVLVRMLRGIPQIGEINLTTNGARLEALAKPLRDAGLTRLNISVDTLRPERAEEIARRDYFDAVRRGIDKAHGAGFPIKFNVVVMRGTNDDELVNLVHYASGYGAQIRFIEYMPMGLARFDEHNSTVTAGEMLERLRADFDLEPVAPEHASDPARAYRCRRTGARVGFITSMSDDFCSTCNRMRLTAQGGLRPCLHQEAEVNLRAMLRRPDGGDEEIRAAFFEAAGLKWAGHHMNDVIPLYSVKEMVAIGG